MAVATQVGYLGGELQPNATAIARRVPIEQPSLSAATTGTVSLEVAVLVLGLDRARLHGALREWRAQLTRLSAELGERLGHRFRFGCWRPLEYRPSVRLRAWSWVRKRCSDS